MKHLRSPSPTTAASQFVKELDDRFDAHLTTIDGQSSIFLNPSEPVKVDISIQGKAHDVSHVTESLKKGLVTDIANVTVSVTGSELIDWATSQSAAIQIAKVAPLLITL